MAGMTADCAAFEETVVFLGHFKDLEDPRQQGKVDYPLEEILILCLLAVLAGADTVTDIALFGRKTLICCVASGRSQRARRRTITSVTSWLSWTLSNSSAALSPGSRR